MLVVVGGHATLHPHRLVVDLDLSAQECRGVVTRVVRCQSEDAIREGSGRAVQQLG
jgi:hypothetical protein